MDNKEIRSLIVESGKRLVKENLVQGTWGNISMRIDDTYMLITPSGMDYGRMTEKDLIIMNFKTMEYEGDVKPSSEKDIHAGIYLDKREINAVIHTHPSYCCSVAATRKELAVSDEKAAAIIGGSIKVAKYGLPSTKGLAKSTLEAMKGRNGCLMANHGVVVCGKTIEDAFDVIKVMEECSKEFIANFVATATGEFNKENTVSLFKKLISK